MNVKCPCRRLHMPDGKFPVFLAFIAVPAELVDVNVHPRKMEVKFVYPNEVFTALRKCVSASLESHVLAPKMETRTPEYFSGYAVQEPSIHYGTPMQKAEQHLWSEESEKGTAMEQAIK